MMIPNYYVMPALKRKVVPPTMDEVVEHVCQVCEVEKKTVFSRGRRADVVFARYVIMYALRLYTTPRMTITAIGMAFNRDHTTVIHATHSIENYLYTNQGGIGDHIRSILSRWEQ